MSIYLAGTASRPGPLRLVLGASLPAAWIAALASLACQCPAFAGEASPSAAAAWSSIVNAVLWAIDTLRQDSSTWAAVSRLVVGGAAGLLAYLLAPMLRIGGVFGCIGVGILGSALAGWLGGHFGFAVPLGVSPIAVCVGLVACLTILAGAKVARHM